MLTEQPLQHFGDVLHQAVDLNRLRLIHLSTAECQQLRNELSGAISGLEYLFRLGPRIDSASNE